MKRFHLPEHLLGKHWKIGAFDFDICFHFADFFFQVLSFDVLQRYECEEASYANNIT